MLSALSVVCVLFLLALLDSCTPFWMWCLPFVGYFSWLFYRSTGKKQRSSSGSASKKTKKMLVEKWDSIYIYDFIQCSIIITCTILVFRDNGKKSPSKHVKHGRKGASKINSHHEDAKESSELSNPEDISKAEINSGNVI